MIFQEDIEYTEENNYLCWNISFSDNHQPILSSIIDGWKKEAINGDFKQKKIYFKYQMAIKVLNSRVRVGGGDQKAQPIKE